jgi:Rieske Fe-S protein
MSEPPRELHRRRLLGVGVGVVGTGVACVALGPAIVLAIQAPAGAGPGAFVAIGDRRRFRPGRPVKVEIRGDVQDGWVRFGETRLGSCWIVELDGELVAFSTVCPHLGCAIGLAPDGDRFACPCHRSAFGLDGRREAGPSPRDLDRLELREEAGIVAVRWARFRPGVPTQEPV